MQDHIQNSKKANYTRFYRCWFYSKNSIFGGKLWINCCHFLVSVSWVSIYFIPLEQSIWRVMVTTQSYITKPIIKIISYLCLSSFVNSTWFNSYSSKFWSLKTRMIFKIFPDLPRCCFQNEYSNDMKYSPIIGVKL